MRQQFRLSSGTSAHVFDGTLLPSKHSCVVYRVAVEAFDGAELKVHSEGLSRMLTPSDTLPSIDMVIGKNLYIEAVGEGAVSGWFEALFVSAR